MKRERRFEWWGKTMLLGAGSALAVGLGGGMLSPALAQTGSAVSASLPTACPGLEALVSDEVDGTDPWGQGEVIKFATSLSQGTLTNNLSPLGATADPAAPAEAETSNREGQGGLSRTPRPPWPSPPPSAPACRTAPRPATPDR
jgi:hypothetical protein